MQLIQLRYFCTVARCQNMSRAADELWISQPALSRAISTLEDELGVKLFERVGRSIQLNAAGQLYYRQVSHILQLLGDATRQVQDLGNSGCNEVRVLFSAANFICAWFWEQYEQRFPQIKLIIKDCYAPTPFDLADCEFLIYATPSEYPAMESVALLEEELALAMSENHPLAKCESVALADTVNYRFQSLPIHENLQDNLYKAYQNLGMEPDIAFRTEASFTFFNTLSSTNLLAMVPTCTAFPALGSKLVLRPIRDIPCRRTIYLGWNKEQYLSDTGRQFIDYCKELFTELGERRAAAADV